MLRGIAANYAILLPPQILDSEGEQQSVINRAEAHKRDIVLQSEARREESMNRALGESIYITNVANATAASIEASRWEGRHPCMCA